MVYQARWGPKGFLLSPTKIVPFSDFSTSLTLKSDSENDTSGTPPTNTRGRELRPIKFKTQYYRALGVDPRAQHAEWESLLGKSYPLYIGGKLFGPPKMMLTGVSLDDLKLTPAGEWISCDISLTLEEYSAGKTSALTTTKSSASTKKTALNTTASTADKAAKKAKGTRGYTL